MIYKDCIRPRICVQRQIYAYWRIFYSQDPDPEKTSFLRSNVLESRYVSENVQETKYVSENVPRIQICNWKRARIRIYVTENVLESRYVTENVLESRGKVPPFPPSHKLPLKLCLNCIKKAFYETCYKLKRNVKTCANNGKLYVIIKNIL